MNYLLPERLDRLAREYALGTLAGPARRRFERVLQSSPAASMAVDVWRQRLAVLDLSIVPRQPPEATWQKIEQRLFGTPQPAPAAASPWQRAVQALLGVLSGRTIAGALAGLLLCAVLVRVAPGMLGLEPRADALPASYVGLLLDAGGKPKLVASSRRQGRQLTVKLLQPLAVPAGQVAQLWALPKDGGAPLAVGVVPASGSARIALPDASEKLFFTVSQLAVSFETSPVQAGGAPSGPFVLIGHCVKVW
ncbi:MAG: anti-sigma factor [Pseudomonadota bacterium]